MQLFSLSGSAMQVMHVFKQMKNRGYTVGYNYERNVFFVDISEDQKLLFSNTFGAQFIGSTDDVPEDDWCDVKG